MEQIDQTTDESFVQNFLRQPVEDDRNLLVRFFIAPVLLGFKSEQMGRPQYEDREHVEISIKGQDKQVVVREVTNADRDRFPIAYGRFKNQTQDAATGTPIEMMPGVGPSFALHLRSIHIRTVEDLAAVSDEAALMNIGMGARDLVEKAKAWVASQTPEKIKLEQQLADTLAQNKQLSGHNEELRAQIAAFGERIAQLEKPSVAAIRRKARGA